MYLLDTNICIYIIKNNSTGIREHLKEVSIGEVGISVITEAELRFGVEKSSFPVKNLVTLQRFLLPLEIQPFTSACSVEYAKLRAKLEKKGTPIGAMDMPIASQALALNAILVTNNEREFRRISNLNIENWTL